MTVAELIKQLQAMPQDCVVEVNDNLGGECWDIEQVDDFPADKDNTAVVMIQVNC